MAAVSTATVGTARRRRGASPPLPPPPKRRRAARCGGGGVCRWKGCHPPRVLRIGYASHSASAEAGRNKEARGVDECPARPRPFPLRPPSCVAPCQALAARCCEQHADPPPPVSTQPLGIVVTTPLEAPPSRHAPRRAHGAGGFGAPVCTAPPLFSPSVFLARVARAANAGGWTDQRRSLTRAATTAPRVPPRRHTPTRRPARPRVVDQEQGRFAGRRVRPPPRRPPPPASPHPPTRRPPVTPAAARRVACSYLGFFLFLVLPLPRLPPRTCERYAWAGPCYTAPLPPVSTRRTAGGGSGQAGAQAGVSPTMRSRPGSGLPPAGRPSTASSRLAPAVTASSVRRHHRWRLRWRRGGRRQGGAPADAAAAAAATLVGPAPGGKGDAGGAAGGEGAATAAGVPAIPAALGGAPLALTAAGGAVASTGGGLAPSASTPAVGGGSATAALLTGSSSAVHVDTDLFGRGDERVFAPLSDLAAASGDRRGGGGLTAGGGGGGSSRGMASGRSSLRSSMLGRSWTARRSPSSSGGLSGGGGGRLGGKGDRRGTAADAQVLSIARALAERDAKLAAFGAGRGGGAGAAAAAGGGAAGPGPGITRLRVEGVVPPGSTVPAPRLVADTDTAGAAAVDGERALLPARSATVAVMRGARGRGAGTRLPAALFPPATAAGSAAGVAAGAATAAGGVAGVAAPHARGVRAPVCNDGRDYTARGRAEQAVAAVAAARAAALVAAAPTARPAVAAPAATPPGRVAASAAAGGGDIFGKEGESAPSAPPLAIKPLAAPAAETAAASNGEVPPPPSPSAAVPVPAGLPAIAASGESLAAAREPGEAVTAVAEGGTPPSTTGGEMATLTLPPSAPDNSAVAPPVSAASAVPAAAPPAQMAASAIPVATSAAQEAAPGVPVAVSPTQEAAPALLKGAPAAQQAASAAPSSTMTTLLAAPPAIPSVAPPSIPSAAPPSMTLATPASPPISVAPTPSAVTAVTPDGESETRMSPHVVVAAVSTSVDNPDAEENLHEESETCSSDSSCHDWACDGAPTAVQTTPPVSRPAPVQGDEFLRKLALASSSTTASPEGATSPHRERFCPPLEASLIIQGAPMSGDAAGAETAAAAADTTVAVPPLPVEEALRFVDAEDDDDTGSAESVSTPQTPAGGPCSPPKSVMNPLPAAARASHPHQPAARETCVHPPAKPAVLRSAHTAEVCPRPRSRAPTSVRDGETSGSQPRRDAVSNVVRSIEAAIQRSTEDTPLGRRVLNRQPLAEPPRPTRASAGRVPRSHSAEVPATAAPTEVVRSGVATATAAPPRRRRRRQMSVIPAAIARQEAAVVYGLPPTPVPTSPPELPDLCLPDGGGASETVGTPLTPLAISSESLPAARSVNTAAASPAARRVGHASSVAEAATGTAQAPASPAVATSPSAASRVRAMVAALDMRAAGLPSPPVTVPSTPPEVASTPSVRRSLGRDISQSQVIRIQRLVITPPTTPRSANAAATSPTALRMQRPLPYMAKAPPQAPLATSAPPLIPPTVTASPKESHASTTERDSVIKVARAAEAAEAAAQAAVVAAEAVASAVEAAAAQAEQRASKNKRRMQRVNAQSSRPASSGRASRSPNRRVRRQARSGARQLPAAHSEGVSSGREGSGGTGPLPSRGVQLPRLETDMYVGGSDADDDDADAADEALWPEALLSESLRVNAATGSPMLSVSSQDPQDPLSIAMDAMLD